MGTGWRSPYSGFTRESLLRAFLPSFGRDERREVPYRAKRALAMVLMIALACILVAPLTIPSGKAVGLDGTVGTIDHPDLWGDMNPLARSVYWAGDMYCHQMESRSLELNGNQLPFCARDLGIVGGMALAMVASLPLRVRMSPLFLILGLTPMGVDGMTQLLTPYESQNLIRIVTGGIAGMTVALFMAMVFQEVLEREKGETGRHERS